MVATSVDIFRGVHPAHDPRLLPPEVATSSINCWHYYGKLNPIRKLLKLVDVDPTTTKVFRIPEAYENAQEYDGSFWMEFEDTYTDVIRAPVNDDAYDRYYWASNSIPPKYNTKARILAGDPAWLLGISRPSAAPNVSVIGGSPPVITRSYVYTYVSTYGEEGPPSSPDLVTGNEDGTWQVIFTDPDANDLGVFRTIDKIRIYRTITSSAGVATYFFVSERNPGTSPFLDVFDDEVVVANEQLQSDEWVKPPSDLRGWTMMPNGIVAAFRGNEVWFSEPYRPHAWPPSYVLTVEYPIVGLGVVNQTLVVCTAGNPIVISGSHPAGMTQSKLVAFEPCISRGSIVSATEGVYYSSPSGLILVNPGGAINTTKEIVHHSDWHQLVAAQKFHAARLGSAYVGFGAITTGVFNTEAFDEDAFTQFDLTGSFNGLLIDPTDVDVGFTYLNSNDPTTSVQSDAWTGDVLFIRNDAVYNLDQSRTDLEYDVAYWRSKIFETNEDMNFGAVKVTFQLEGNQPTLNPVRDIALDQEMTDDKYGIFRLYADDRLVMTRELRKSNELMRPPAGFKATEWYFEIETRVKINRVQLANTASELGLV